MAAKAVAVPSQVGHFEFWRSFQRSAEFRVRECNAVAGEHLWHMTSGPEPALKFTVEASAFPADCIECSFDLDRGILTFSPGPAIKVQTGQFQLVPGAAGTLEHRGRVFTLEQALARILDHLVTVDES